MNEQKTLICDAQAAPLPEMLRYHEVCAMLKCSASKVRTMVMMREIPHYKFGASVRFDRAEIEEWIKSRKVEVYKYAPGR